MCYAKYLSSHNIYMQMNSGADTGFFLTTAKKFKNGRNNHLRP